MTLRPERILPVLQGMFGPGVSVAAHEIGAPTTALSEAEGGAIVHAIANRRAEFQAGRHAAKIALTHLGATQFSIPMAQDRAPVWPVGFTGSISHSAGLAIAAVTATSNWQSLGLDLEPLTPLEPELWDEILTPSEHAWLKTHPKTTQGTLAKAVFSIKECVYKAQYVLSGALLNFDAFSTTLSMETGTFQVVFQYNVSPFQKGEILRGTLAKTDQMLITACAL